MNYLELVQRLKRESKRSGGVPASIAVLSGEDIDLANWVNDAWLEVQRKRMDWAWMRKTIAGELVESQLSYAVEDLDFVRIAFTAGSTEYVRGDALVQGAVTATVTRAIVTSGDWGTSDAAGELIIAPISGEFVAGAAVGGGACNLSGPAVSLAPFARWQDETEFYTVFVSNTAAGGQPWPLRWMPYEKFQASFVTGTISPGAPQYWSVGPGKKLLIGPAPNSADYMVTADYWAKPTALVDDADEPDMPEQFHLLLVWRGLLEVSSVDAAPEVEVRARRNMRMAWADLIDDQAPRTQLSDEALA